MDLRNKLLQHKPKVTEIEILGEKYYVRALSVGDVNRGLFGQHKLLCDIAKAQGIELDYDDPNELGKQLGKVYDPYRLARNLALRLCDKDGNLLFDFENEVARHLSEKNYTVKQKWRVGSYDIDMVAIYDDKKIAIECDGKTLNHTEEEVIANLEEQEILERCGWEFIRIRASEYFRNPEKAIKDLIIQLDDKGIYPNHKEIYTDKNELLNNIKSEALERMEKYEEE